MQEVIDAIIRGGFDDGRATFEKSKDTVIKAATTWGAINVKRSEVHCAFKLGTLYGELSRCHPGVSRTLAVHHSEQTLPEAIAALSIIHFARCAYGSSLDATYYGSIMGARFTLSAL